MDLWVIIFLSLTDSLLSVDLEELSKRLWNVSSVDAVVLGDVHVEQVALQDGERSSVKHGNENARHQVGKHEDKHARHHAVWLHWGHHWWNNEVADRGGQACNKDFSKEHEGSGEALDEGELGTVLQHEQESVQGRWAE